jgi:hypothetical protein
MPDFARRFPQKIPERPQSAEEASSCASCGVSFPPLKNFAAFKSSLSKAYHSAKQRRRLSYLPAEANPRLPDPLSNKTVMLPSYHNQIRYASSPYIVASRFTHNMSLCTPQANKAQKSKKKRGGTAAPHTRAFIFNEA